MSRIKKVAFVLMFWAAADGVEVTTAVANVHPHWLPH